MFFKLFPSCQTCREVEEEEEEEEELCVRNGCGRGDL
jgi:hypothetical protein